LFDRKLKLPIGKGVRQGDTISPKLFTAALQDAMKDLNGTIKATLSTVNGSATFASSTIFLTSTSTAEVEEMLNELNVAGMKIGLDMSSMAEGGLLRTILYADDIALVANNQEELKEKVQLWQRTLADNGLRLNVKKTKFVSSEQCAGSILDCQGEAIEKVEEFLYLGSDLSEEGSVDQAVRGQINAAWLKWRESTGILCDRRCSKTLKGNLY
uniref:Reverse transcriptase domain-containing protein n=1 Tax=Heligmosomoides polygyrus TaxID=6339 RepID=A0A183GIP1_HELPZ